MTSLVAENITVRAGDATLVNDATLTLNPGELVAILGPNGAGKTSLLRAMLGLAPVAGGIATLDGSACLSLSPSVRARKVSYLPQRRPLAWPNKVRDVVALGRFSHGATLGKLSEPDAQAVDEAIKACDLMSLAQRTIDSLSGGEVARVHFARAFAARAPLLVADEPVAALDPRHQLRIAELLREFVDAGGGALVVLHEVALAAQFADRLIWMSGGSVVAEGTPKETLDAKIMKDVYGVKAFVNHDEHGFDVRIEGAV
jgi:iron complex transport system ATP-binding protein